MKYLSDPSVLTKTVFRITLFFLSISFLVWAAMPKFESHIAGFIIGTAGSLLMQRHLAWKIERLSTAAINQTKPRASLGFLTRASLALLAVVISTQYFHYHLYMTLAGLFVTQGLTFVLVLFSLRKQNNDSSDERGENETWIT